jgi:hypothetical protein
LNDVIIIKYDPNGNLIWQKKYNGPGNNSDQAYGTFVDQAGNIYVTGFASDSLIVTRFLTLKLDPGGNILWSQIYSPQNFSQGCGFDVLTDNNSNVYACGYVKAANGFYDILTLKYSFSGLLLASASYNGVSNHNDAAISICLDEQGNIIVFGITKQSANDRLILLRYNNGFQPVRFVYSGSAAGDDKAVKVTSFQNSLYIASSVRNQISGYDYNIMKLSSFSDISWVKSFNGTGNHQDLVYDMFIKNGYVYVTGSSRNADSLWFGRYCNIMHRYIGQYFVAESL